MRTTKPLTNEMCRLQEPSRQEIAKGSAQGLKPRMVSAKVGKHELIIFGGGNVCPTICGSYYKGVGATIGRPGVLVIT